MSDQAETWQDVAAAADLPPGTVVEAVAGGAIVAVANVSGELVAIDGLCAHQGGPLGKGKLNGSCLTCPWHGWQYNLPSGRQKLSQTIAQRRFAVRRRGDRIEVREALA